ncbi:MAG: hypothetical protein Q8S15_09420 [Erysipelotrichaceae bacterium]|nr:hypothetical protein [Erysipelotrichaceae bacterium]MDP3306282.1 hypothetical protein [Erysipelotrichaceae bacterium]
MSFFTISLSAIAQVLTKLPEIQFISQLDVFKLQIEQLLTLSFNHKIEDSQFCFDLDIRRFCIITDANRIVKTPGYEILLDDVSEVQWGIVENEFSIRGVYDQNPFTVVIRIN